MQACTTTCLLIVSQRCKRPKREFKRFEAFMMVMVCVLAFAPLEPAFRRDWFPLLSGAALALVIHYGLCKWRLPTS